MDFTAFTACLACKAVHALLRLFHRGGTALPGKIALKICPRLLEILARSFKVISVTGTNGKTTSCRMLEKGLREAGYTVFANRSGANLTSGITTEFVLNSTLTGKPKTEWAVIECDEATTLRVFKDIQPKTVLVTNLFRDQLDRYGEISHTRDCIIEALKASPDTLICLNADCSLTASIADCLTNPVRYYGVDKAAASAGRQPSALSDASHCIRCRRRYEYSYITYAHLGGFKCPGCGYERRSPDVTVREIISRTRDGSNIVLDIDGAKLPADINLPAIYNIYNAAGAVAAMTGSGIEAQIAVSAVSETGCAFGRMEKLELGRAGCRMILVKNPAAFDQALEYLCRGGERMILVLGLNDRAADGRDVSWIWDVNMERLGGADRLLERVVVFGDRYADMALRLKYAGVDTQKLELIRGCDCKATLEQIKDAQYPLLLLTTYTAMMKLRAQAVKKHGVKFWEQ